MRSCNQNVSHVRVFREKCFVQLFSISSERTVDFTLNGVTSSIITALPTSNRHLHDAGNRIHWIFQAMILQNRFSSRCNPPKRRRSYTLSKNIHETSISNLSKNFNIPLLIISVSALHSKLSVTLRRTPKSTPCTMQWQPIYTYTIFFAVSPSSCFFVEQICSDEQCLKKNSTLIISYN